ncbi:MAG: sigma-70 family RNA polymerase sigma factor [Moraxellaceae bacterium]|nr:sigma-70 family RNA polymerase sigma factor [Pseudobdellovibrionaceae bacterium]
MKSVTLCTIGAYTQVNEREDQLKNLFLLAKDNDEQAYKALLVEISGLLRAYLLKLMSPRIRSIERAEDLVQEILITIHRKRDLYSVDRPFLPWIYAIAKYRFIDSLRAESRNPEFEEWTAQQDSRMFLPTAQKADEENTDEILQGLTAQQKAILTMAKVEEVPLKEIAEHFKMSVSAVKVTIHRVLKNLRM